TSYIYSLSLHDALPILFPFLVCNKFPLVIIFLRMFKYSCSAVLIMFDIVNLYLVNVTGIFSGPSKNLFFDTTINSFSIMDNKFRSEEHTSELQSRENLV